MKKGWYNSELGKFMGYALFAGGIGLGMGQILRGCHSNYYLRDIAQYQSQEKIEVQRLRTIEEIVRKLDSSLQPSEMQKFLEDINFTYKPTSLDSLDSLKKSAKNPGPYKNENRQTE